VRADHPAHALPFAASGAVFLCVNCTLKRIERAGVS